MRNAEALSSWHAAAADSRPIFCAFDSCALQTSGVCRRSPHESALSRVFGALCSGALSRADAAPGSQLSACGLPLPFSPLYRMPVQGLSTNTLTVPAELDPEAFVIWKTEEDTIEPFMIVLIDPPVW